MSEAFVYKWENKTNGMKYIGYHKGEPDDGYIASPSNKNFWKDFKDNGHEFERTIIGSGSTKDMIELEAMELQKVEASKNEMFYNMRNGSKSLAQEIDFDQIERLVQIIETRSREPESKPTDDVWDYPRKQVRKMKILTSKVSDIMDRIEANTLEENEKNISPLVIVTNYQGEPWLLDGNHTIRALRNLKYQYVKTITIDFDDDLQGSETMLTQLGLRLNKPELIEGGIDNEDIKRCLAEYLEDDVDIESLSFKEQLCSQLGISKSRLGKLVHSVITTAAKPTNWKVWEKDELNAIVQKLSSENPDASVAYMGSESIVKQGFGAILRTMYNESKQKGILLIHHNKPSYEKKYYAIPFTDIASHHGLNIDIRFLPTYDYTT